MTKQSVTEWIMDHNTCFLLGAGCSLCAKKPTIDRLTEMVRDASSQAVQVLLGDIRGKGNRKANVEDLINYLLRMRQLMDSRKTPLGREDWRIDTIDEELLNIQKAIVEGVGADWQPSEHHERFLVRLATSKRRRPIDIFCLNYDTVLEASMESIRVRYTDGFVGSENAYFEPSAFEQIPTNTVFFRLYKLHGSVNWIRDHADIVRRRPGSSLADTPRAVVYPAEQKYLQTQYGVYETLMRLFRDRLRDPDNNNKLVVLGYSFGDEHINAAIEDGIRSPQSNLTVHAFVGPEDDVEAQKARFELIASRCEHRFNAVICNKYCVGPGLDDAEWRDICGGELWKFENVVNLLTEAGNE